MRYLFCSLDSLGFLYTSIGIAQILQQRGHTVACVADQAHHNLLQQVGITRIPRTEIDGPSFQVVRWWHELEVALQVRHLDYAIAMFRPDILVGQVLTLGPLIAAEQHGLPLAILGLLPYLWATSSAPPRSDLEQRRLERYQEMLAYYNKARTLFHLPTCIQPPEQNPFLGQLFLLQSVPATTPRSADLPEQVRLIGSCLWEPPGTDAELGNWLARASKQGGTILYAQPGRSFRAPTFWHALTAPQGNRPRWIAASLDRMPGNVDQLPPTFFARPYVPQHQVLPYAQAVIANGNTTATLGALTHGLPLVLFPGGGEQPDIAELCESLGVAQVLPSEVLVPERLEQLLDEVLRYPEIRERAVLVQEAFRQIDGPVAAAVYLEALGH